MNLDSSAFESALKGRMVRLGRSTADKEERMASDIAKRASAIVTRRTGQTAEGIESKGGEHRATNPYLEFGTTHMAAQPFFRPARHQVEQAFRAGRYRPEL